MSILKSIPPATFLLQGGLTMAGGIYALARPGAFMEMAKPMGFGGTPAQVIHSSSLQLITMGTYFMLSAGQPGLWRKALSINIGLRLMAAYIFWNDGVQLRTVAMWEVFWAALNAVAIPFVDMDPDGVE